ncbi:15395_t:CDS:1, partial [Cetraspora pellucida]
ELIKNNMHIEEENQSDREITNQILITAFSKTFKKKNTNKTKLKDKKFKEDQEIPLEDILDDSKRMYEKEA